VLKLHAPNGDPVEIRPQDIETMFPNGGSYHPNARTVIVLNDIVHGLQNRAVKETVDEIETLIVG
jgi:hypothetical protein